MSSAVYRVAALSAICSCAPAAPIADPSLARSAHFEVYSQAGEASARAVLVGFERLRAFFLQQTGLKLDNRPPVRVIAFRSREEYTPYRLRPTADAYYVGAESRDSIVMIGPNSGDFRVAAHEYAHFVLHANGIELPPWLGEGLPEFFSMVRMGDRGGRTHTELPVRSQILRTHVWIPLAELMTLPSDSPLREQRESADLFYAESWALTDMLMVSPKYSPRFPELFAALAAGKPSPATLSAVYGRPLDEITADLHAWVSKRRITPAPLPSVSVAGVGIEVTAIAPLAWRAVLAELLLDTRKLDQAQEAYQALAREVPKSADFVASLATIALEKGDRSGAAQQWQRALDLGLRDAAVCYRYAVLANAAGFSGDEVRPALERAVAVQPHFDEPHYLLAIIESNAGHYEAAVAHLRAMGNVAPARRFHYWATLSYAWIELGQREEAKAAARRAREFATTPDERAHAIQLAEIAQTDIAVQFTRDANGNSRLVTTRVPHDAPDWNPFIEPSDRVRRVEGKLREIDCSDGTTKIDVETAVGTLRVAIPDPLRVQMRNAPPEFTCGPQPRTAVTVVYAESGDAKIPGVVRGIEFQ